MAQIYESASKKGRPTDPVGYTKLHAAVQNNDINELTKLIDQGFDLDAVISAGSKRSYTALHLATEAKNRRIIKILLQSGSDFTLENRHNDNPLSIACRKKNDDMIEMYFKAFCTACSKINKDIEKVFAERGLPIHYQINFGKDFLKNFKPLHFAVKFQLTEIIVILVNFGVDLELRDARGMTALHCLVNELSVFKGTDSFCTKALARVVHKFAENETGFSRTIYIIDQIISLFMTKCRDVKNLLDNHRRTPLSYLYEGLQSRGLQVKARFTCCGAMKSSRLITDCVRVNLIDQLLRIPAVTASLPLADDKGNTVLHSLAKAGPRSPNQWEVHTIVRRYLAEGGDINAANHSGFTPLHYSVHKYNMSMADTLLGYGADVNAVSNNGSTAYSILRRTQGAEHYSSALIFSYLRRMVVLGVPTCPSNSQRYERDGPYIDERCVSVDECKAELERMKAQKIDPYTTLYDLLRKDPRDLLYHVSNQELANKEFLEGFPIYGYLVKSKINQAKLRAALFEPAWEALQSIIKRNLPDSCLTAIMRNLNIADMKVLIDTKVNKED